MKKINWKNVSIILLIASNLFLLNGVKTIEKNTINKIYMEQVENGFYNESETDEVRNPITRKLEQQLQQNNKNGMY